MITQEYLKSWLRYDETTGEFFWLKSPAKNIVVGCKAGSINSLGYLQIQIEGVLYYGHTLAWFYVHGEYTRVDHKDLNRGNTRINNLRKCTQSQNIANSSISVLNTTGYKGVSFNRRLEKYQAYIKVNYRKIHLGYFDRVEDAGAAYVTAAQKHFGLFARTK